MPLYSPDRPCPDCGGLFWDLVENSCDRVCQKCKHRETDTPLEDVAPGLTAQILRARIAEEEGECGSED